MSPIALLAGLAFAVLGAAAERLASFWPADEATGRGPGPRTVLLAAGSGLAAWAITARSTLPWWATAFHLGVLALLVVLTATDLEQRRLPRIVLDPLIVAGVAFVPFNPSVSPLDALIGAASAIIFLGALGLIIRGGVAMGDLYLIAPIGLILGWPAIFSAVFIAALLSAVVSLGLLASRRVGLKSYIPFGPFLVAGAVVTLIREPTLLSVPAETATTLLMVLGIRS